MNRYNKCRGCSVDLTSENRVPGRVRCKECHAAYHRGYRGRVAIRQSCRAEQAIRDRVKLVCRSCGEEKLCVEFPLHPCTKTGFNRRCLACSGEYLSKYNQKPEVATRARARGLRRRYGLTPGEVAGLSDQDPTCAICGASFSARRREPFVDHCHTSGKVRGLLCVYCNSGLGYFRDSPANLARAVEYLKNRGSTGCRNGGESGTLPLSESIPPAPVAGPDG